MKASSRLILCIFLFELAASVVGYQAKTLYFTADLAKDKNMTVYHKDDYRVVKTGDARKSDDYASIKE